MTDKKKNFITRTITSIVFVVVLVGCILWHPLAYAVLFGAITAMTAWEFCTIVNRHADLQVNKLITTISCVYLFLAVMGYNLNMAGSGVSSITSGKMPVIRFMKIPRSLITMTD